MTGQRQSVSQDAGTPVTGRPGWVTGTCGHPAEASEWRAGYTSCRQCPQPAAEPANQGVTGTANMAAYQWRRTYTCADCGGHGTVPTHARWCERSQFAALWAAGPVAAARAAYEEHRGLLQQIVLEGTAQAGTEFEDRMARLAVGNGAILGHLGQVLAAIDARAGAL